MKRWGEKRYYSLDYYLKETYHKKLYKIALNGGMTCPNRDGTLGSSGCIFCSAGGSGDFASNPGLSITQQINEGRALIAKKTDTHSFIAYFQAYTNTYAPVSYLEQIFTEAIRSPYVEILSIATRPDCLGEEVITLLSRLNQIKPVWVELGLQTSSEVSADYIRRGYSLAVFEDALDRLRAHHIPVIVHTIIGLPSEPKEGILDTIHYLNTKDIQGIKLQLLHVLKHTDLAVAYEAHPFWLPTMEEYADLICRCIETLREDIVVHRITGDGPKSLLIAPKWTGNKRLVLNTIQSELKRQDIWQGKESGICLKHSHSTN